MTSEDIRLTQGGAYDSDCVRFTQDCTFNGSFTGTTATSEWWWFAGGKKIVFNGPFSGFGNILGGDRGTSVNTIDVTWTGPTSFKQHYWQWGTVNHYSPIVFVQNKSRENLRIRGGGTYNLYCADVFGDETYSARLYWENANATSRTTVFNVVSNDQHFSYILNGAYSAGTKFDSQTEGVTIHLEAGTDYSDVPTSQVFNGTFMGTVGLSVEGPLPLTLGGANSSTGTLTLTNGAQVAFSANGSWTGPINICQGNGSAETLTLSSTLAVEALYTNGVRLASGKYGAMGSDALNKLALRSF